MSSRCCFAHRALHGAASCVAACCRGLRSDRLRRLAGRAARTSSWPCSTTSPWASGCWPPSTLRRCRLPRAAAPRHLPTRAVRSPTTGSRRRFEARPDARTQLDPRRDAGDGVTEEPEVVLLRVDADGVLARRFAGAGGVGHRHDPAPARGGVRIQSAGTRLGRADGDLGVLRLIPDLERQIVGDRLFVVPRWRRPDDRGRRRVVAAGAADQGGAQRRGDRQLEGRERVHLFSMLQVAATRPRSGASPLSPFCAPPAPLERGGHARPKPFRRARSRQGRVLPTARLTTSRPDAPRARSSGGPRSACRAAGCAIPLPSGSRRGDAGPPPAERLVQDEVHRRRCPGRWKRSTRAAAPGGRSQRLAPHRA